MKELTEGEGFYHAQKGSDTSMRYGTGGVPLSGNRRGRNRKGIKKTSAQGRGKVEGDYDFSSSSGPGDPPKERRAVGVGGVEEGERKTRCINPPLKKGKRMKRNTKQLGERMTGTLPRF